MFWLQSGEKHQQRAPATLSSEAASGVFLPQGTHKQVFH
jgi:hypothetical protein